jgi:hypothetical protein
MVFISKEATDYLKRNGHTVFVVGSNFYAESPLGAADLFISANLELDLDYFMLTVTEVI